MDLEKPPMIYVSPLPPKQGGFYYREQHLAAFRSFFDVKTTSPWNFITGVLAFIIIVAFLPFIFLVKIFTRVGGLTYHEYDFASYSILSLPIIVLLRVYGEKNIFRLHEDYTNLSYGWILRLWDNFWLMFAANLIVVHTEEHKKKLWPTNRMKTRVLISGIDIVKRKTKPEKNTIIIPGFVSSWKGHDIILKALAEVKEEIPDVKLIIAGKKHNDAYFRELTKDILLHDLQNNVELHLDYLPREEMQKLLKRAKIAVLPYRRITFSAALCDCLDWEIPTITSDIPEFKELAPELPKFHIYCWEYNHDHDENSSSELCLSSEIIKLLKDKRHYNTVQKSVLSLKQEYDWKKIVRKEAELIYSLS